MQRTAGLDRMRRIGRSRSRSTRPSAWTMPFRVNGRVSSSCGQFARLLASACRTRNTVIEEAERNGPEGYLSLRMARIQLRDLCGVRSGDKGDISDLALFADDEAAYEAILDQVTSDRVKAHFGSLVRGPVERYEARNVLALKFVMHDALGGGAPRSLRADNLGKTLGAALLRLKIDVPDDVAKNARRRHEPINRTE